MNKKSSTILQLILLIFIAGAGYAIGRFTSSPKIEMMPESTTQTVTVKDASDKLALSKALSEVDALKAENLRLKALMNQPKEEVLQQPQEATEEPLRAEDAPPRRQTWRERMEELREKDPERYAQEVERRENFAKMMEQRRAERVNFLDSIDTSLLSVEAQGIHARFVSAIARQGQLQREIMATLEAGEQPSEELSTQMQETFREITETRDSERTALLDAIAISMGLAGEEVEDFTHLVNEVFSATGGPMMMRMGRRGGMPPPPAN